jgi:hypothetical protein
MMKYIIDVASTDFDGMMKDDATVIVEGKDLFKAFDDMQLIALGIMGTHEVKEVDIRISRI